MIVLLDTDVLIDVALDRKPFAEYSSGVLDAAERHFFQTFIAWHSVSNFYYLVGSRRDDSAAREFIVEMLEFIDIASTTTKDVFYAARLKLSDFEDALQVAAGRACKAEYIITRNVNHYRTSPIPVHTPEAFLQTFFVSS